MSEQEIRDRMAVLNVALDADEFKERGGISWFDLQKWDAKHPEIAARRGAIMSEYDALRKQSEQIRIDEQRAAWRLESLREAGLGEREIALLATAEQKPALVAARQWLASDSDFLLLSGGAGTGKTIAAAVVLSDFRDSEKEPSINFDRKRQLPRGAMMVRAVAGPAIGLFDEASQKKVEQMRGVAFLVIDDMGTEMLTDVWRQNLDDVIDYRYSNKLRTIITTNLTPDAFKERYGARIADRIRHTAKIVLVGADSMRKRNPPPEKP